MTIKNNNIESNHMFEKIGPLNLQLLAIKKQINAIKSKPHPLQDKVQLATLIQQGNSIKQAMKSILEEVERSDAESKSEDSTPKLPPAPPLNANGIYMEHASITQELENQGFIEPDGLQIRDDEIKAVFSTHIIQSKDKKLRLCDLVSVETIRFGSELVAEGHQALEDLFKEHLVLHAKSQSYELPAEYEQLELSIPLHDGYGHILWLLCKFGTDAIGNATFQGIITDFFPPPVNDAKNDRSMGDIKGTIIQAVINCFPRIQLSWGMIRSRYVGVQKLSESTCFFHVIRASLRHCKIQHPITDIISENKSSFNQMRLLFARLLLTAKRKDIPIKLDQFGYIVREDLEQHPRMFASYQQCLAKNQSKLSHHLPDEITISQAPRYTLHRILDYILDNSLERMTDGSIAPPLQKPYDYPKYAAALKRLSEQGNVSDDSSDDVEDEDEVESEDVESECEMPMPVAVKASAAAASAIQSAPAVDASSMPHQPKPAISPNSAFVCGKRKSH